MTKKTLLLRSLARFAQAVPRTPTFCKISSAVALASSLLRTSLHTASGTRWSSGSTLQFGDGSVFSHLKSSTWSH